MNKDVQGTVLSNVLSILKEYTSHSFGDSDESNELLLSNIISDSLSVLEIIYELEDKYQVTIRADRLKSLYTVADLVSALDQELKSAA